MHGRGWFVVVFCISTLLQQLTVSQNPTDDDVGCSEMVDAVFLIDSSLSVRELCPQTGDNWQLVLKFISEVVGAMPLDRGAARVGIATFSTALSAAEHVITLDQSTAADALTLRRRIFQLPFLGGNTNATGALRYARAELARARTAAIGVGTLRKQYVVLLTDGASNVGGDPVREGRLIKEDGVWLFTVGITEYVDVDQLKEMASAPAAYSYIHANDFSHLNLFVGQLLDRLICSNPPPAQPCRDSRADIAFVLDASGSIIYKSGRPGERQNANYYNWNLMKAFVITLIRNLRVSATETRIALVRFSHDASIVFQLDSYTNAEQAIEAVENMTIVASSTDTSAALRLMRTTVFSKQRGDRWGVNNVGIVITDGQSDDTRATAAEAAAAKAAGIRMYAIGLTDEIDANELKSIASTPLTEHYYNRTSINLVQTVTSQLLWSVCHSPCSSDGTGVCRNNASFCAPGERISWKRIGGHLLLGRSYAILTDVSSPADCQNACLLDHQCRSIQFIASLKQCSISYYTKDQAPDSFRADSEVDYYEIVCVADR